MNEKYIKFLKENIKLKSLTPSSPSNVHHELKCLLCGNIFTAYPKAKMQAYKKSKMPGCPKCTHSYRYSQIDKNNIKKISDLGYITFSPYIGLKEKIEVSNSNCECGRKWWTTPENIFSGNAFCRPCNDDKKRKRFDDLNKERFSLYSTNQKNFTNYKKLVRYYTEKNYKNYKNIINPNNLPRGRSCKENGYHLDHIVSQSYCWKMNIPAKVCAHQNNLRLIDGFSNIAKNSKSINYFPDIFNEYIPFRRKVQEFVNTLNEKFPNTFETNYKLGDYTFDIKYNNYVISLLLFEENKESFNLNRRLNINIYNFANKNNLIYIPIFEHEWDNSRKIVLQKIEHIIGKSNKPKIYGRKTIIREITNSEKSKFLENNHIQGNSGSCINLGCFYNDTLISVMTFSKPRIIMRKKVQNGVFELARFASHNDFIVIGTASKLLNFFMKNYDWNSIYSYADKRWSTGNLYIKLGFEKFEDSDPNYYYYKDGKVYHRFKFAKHNIKKLFPDQFDETLTEYQNMLNLGYDRVWDCGNLKFVINKT
jgi:hypothetical protein